MEIEYERTLDDLIEFHLFHYAHSQSIRQQRFTWRVVMTLLTVLLPFGIIFLIFQQVTALLFVLSTLGGALIFFTYPYLEKKSMMGRLRKFLAEGNNNALLGHQTLTLSPDGILSKSHSGESKLNWSTIVRIVQNEKYLFLYVGAMNAIVIPISAFGSEAQRQEFLNYANNHLEKKD